MINDRVYRYIYQLNQNYYKRNQNPLVLGGYSGVEMDSVGDYNVTSFLIEYIKNNLKDNIESVYDLGCGAGTHLKKLVQDHNIIPSGIDINVLAIIVLQDKVLPEYKDNFYPANISEIKKIDADIVLLTLYEEKEQYDHIDFNCKYIFIRTSKSIAELYSEELKSSLLTLKPSDLGYKGEHIWHLFQKENCFLGKQEVKEE